MHAEKHGPYERHLRRKLAFPELFGGMPPDAAALQRARDEDRLQAAAFNTQFRSLVHEAATLKSNEESERILDLKARLDEAYTEVSGLAGDQSATKEAIRRLTDVIMRAVREGAANDRHAQKELEEEALARAHHANLLQQPLVSDLMMPNSPIPESELVPTLLAESEPAVEAAIWLFGGDQLAEITAMARALLGALSARGVLLPQPSARLAQLERVASSSN